MQKRRRPNELGRILPKGEIMTQQNPFQFNDSVYWDTSKNLQEIEQEIKNAKAIITSKKSSDSGCYEDLERFSWDDEE